MKTRMGFVSNSSSSSFICGIAEIADKTKFDDYIKQKGIELNDYDVFVTTEEDSDNKCDVRLVGGHIVVDSFVTDSRVNRNKPGTMFFVVNISNDEGDYSFWDEEYGEMNYNIDLDYYSTRQQQLYNIFTDPTSGLNMDNADVTYGAERNG